MLRETNIHTLTWADKTMSVLKERQLEACENRLNQLPSFGLFDGCDDAKVEELWQCSYDAQEHPAPERLHTTRQLQCQVLLSLPMEAALLSVEEHMLLERLIVLDGQAELMEWEETRGAEGLVRRLWCTLERREDTYAVRLPRELLFPLTAILASEAHSELRERLLRFESAIRGLLYIGGLLHYAEPLYHLKNDVLRELKGFGEHLLLRYLRNTFDYCYDERGDMLLLHPGLAEPERMIGCGMVMTHASFELDEATLLGAMDGILPEERSLFDRMYGLLCGAVRPEITEEEAVEDLRMLAKQGVSLREMNEVLSSLLTVQPTPAMVEGVRQIHRHTPRWGTMSSGQVQ